MTSATLIDGKQMAADLADDVKSRCAGLIESGIRPGLAVVIVGDDPASRVYVRNKRKKAESLGFHSVVHELASDTAQDALEALVASLNADPAIHGILVQLPLPRHLDEDRITQAIEPAKDVDGFHYTNVGKVAAGDMSTAFLPCTPAGCMAMIESTLGGDLSGKRAVVVGRSNIVGKPMASLLLAANATVTVCHSRTDDLPSVTRDADILVAAVGRPRMIRGDWIKPGAVVIDVGINRIEEDGKERLVGDVDFDEAIDVAGAITPVPGGVGPMTIAMLMANTLRAATFTAAGKND